MRISDWSSDVCSSDLIILGAVGVLQFDVVQYRLRDEYKVESVFEPVQVHTARWIEVDDPKKLKEFRDKDDARLAHDHYGQLVYLARSEERRVGKEGVR